ncbi:LysR family transcriptional regulator [Notoacmeibacter marinus]|uniref:LysR family transcriptional regulator n=1 Tax=Notoacmeibacter marinus TaxID=1876515 RepID=UPI000DF2133D|nr:LysR family transcriptional regulator [Notoacmeibacter marinus]
MNLTQLTAFREIMATGSLSQAAKNLHRTQPAISTALKNLETGLGLPLFERRGHRMVPKPEAQYLLAEAADILDRLTTVSSNLKSLRDGEAGNLHVAAMPGPSAYLFPRYISEVIGESPDIRVSLSSRSSLQIRELVGAQSIDFGFSDYDQPLHKKPQYTAERIQANCFCAMPKTHPLNNGGQVNIRDLDGLAMGALQNSHTLYRRTADAFVKNDAQFNVVIDSQVFLPLIQFIRRGQCLAIVDPLTAATEREMNSTEGSIIFRPLAEPLPYEYAILTPLHRPASRLAMKIKTGWLDHLVDILGRMDADPMLLDR